MPRCPAAVPRSAPAGHRSRGGAAAVRRRCGGGAAAVRRRCGGDKSGITGICHRRATRPASDSPDNGSGHGLTWYSAASWKSTRRIRMPGFHEAVNFHVILTPYDPGARQVAAYRADGMAAPRHHPRVPPGRPRDPSRVSRPASAAGTLPAYVDPPAQMPRTKTLQAVTPDGPSGAARYRGPRPADARRGSCSTR